MDFDAEKPVFGVANNKCADQPAHPHRLISKGDEVFKIP